MQRLKGSVYFIQADKNQNKYKAYITIEGFQDYESLKRFKRSEKRLCFCEGLLILTAGGVIVTLTPDEKMIKQHRKPLEARRLLMHRQEMKG